MRQRVQRRKQDADAGLVALAAAGDLDAVAQLYRRHVDAAWRMALAVTVNPHDAADAVSEAFARVFQALADRPHVGGRFLPYLLAAVRNAAIDGLRRSGRQRSVAGCGDSELTAPDLEPGARIEADEEAALVARAFRRLPERWRSVLWLTEVEGMPAREVAALLQMTPNGVAQLAVRARAGLRRQYLQAHLPDVAVPVSCRGTVSRLGACAAGALAPRDVAKVDQHLAACGTCRSRLTQLREVAPALRRAALPVPAALAALSSVRLHLLPGGTTTAAGASGAVATTTASTTAATTTTTTAASTTAVASTTTALTTTTATAAIPAGFGAAVAAVTGSLVAGIASAALVVAGLVATGAAAPVPRHDMTPFAARVSGPTPPAAAGPVESADQSADPAPLPPAPSAPAPAPAGAGAGTPGGPAGPDLRAAAQLVGGLGDALIRFPDVDALAAAARVDLAPAADTAVDLLRHPPPCPALRLLGLTLPCAEVGAPTEAPLPLPPETASPAPPEAPPHLGGEEVTDDGTGTAPPADGPVPSTIVP